MYLKRTGEYPLSSHLKNIAVAFLQAKILSIKYVVFWRKGEKNSPFLGIQCAPYKNFPEGPNDLGGSRWVNFQKQVRKIGYDVYKKNLKRYLDGKSLRDLRVYPVDYSTHSFRKGGLSMLADGGMHPVYIQKSARHKSWESSVPYIETSLSKALKANDLL